LKISILPILVGLGSRFKWAAKGDVTSSGLRNSPLSAPESDPGWVVGVLGSSLPLRGITNSNFTGSSSPLEAEEVCFWKFLSAAVLGFNNLICE
jgi:hypothetical protein